MKLRAAFAMTALLAGCSMEPHYERPEAPVPPSWPVGDAYLRQSEATLPSVTYRDIFRDPKLQAIIEQALANNRDLRIAAANIASARAQYRVQRSELFPDITAGAGVRLGDSGSSGTSSGTGSGNGNGSGSGSGSSSGNGGISHQYSVDVGLNSWEIDLFGRIRSLSHEALERYFATEAAARATRLSLVSEVATAYLTLAADNSLLAIARATESNAAKAVQLTGARVRGGIAPRIDLRQAETILDQAQSDIAEQTTAVAQDKNALQLLVGAPLDDTLLPGSIESVDGTIGELPAGLNSSILLRRPDVVQAEYQLRAANADIGAARAAFFPTISLTAVAGFASTALASLFSGNAFNWTVSPNANVSIFDFGRNRGNLAYSRAQRDLYVAQYEQAIQTAFREVSDALARRGTIENQYAAQAHLVEASQDTFNLTTARYREGIENFLSSLDAQRTLYSAQRSLVQTRLTRADNLVDLYRTLGGDSLIADVDDSPNWTSKPKP